MTQLIKARVGDMEFWIEPDTSVTLERRIERASVVDSAIERTIDFNLLSEQIGKICSSLKQSLDRVPRELRPSKVSTEFGIKISGSGDIYVVKAGIESTIKISAEWQFS